APNEKVALEVGIGASLAGARVLVAMKHVGVNVAADPLLTLSYTGVGGGLVLVSTDDPGMHSSQNEQDNRHYARLAKIPLLEPADSEEARVFTIAGLALSERFDTPVLLRTTTRISHSRSLVQEGKRHLRQRSSFKKDPAKYVMLPGFARQRRPLVDQRLEALRREAENSPLNRIEKGSSRRGIICSGMAYQYVKEALPEDAVLKLGFSYPLPEKLIRDFAASVEEIIVVEELDPFLEEQIRALLPGVPVRGKELLPAAGELDLRIIREQVGSLERLKTEPPRPLELPSRPPLLCPGCPHRGVFYVLKKLKVTVPGDIGCYTLGALPPLESLHTCICMGSGIGIAAGMERADPTTAGQTVAVIGDSTFFHSGLTALLDLVYSGSRATVIILDNRTTAMTGHQDHPGTGVTLQGVERSPVELEPLCRALGVNRVFTVDPLQLRELEALIKAELAAAEPSVIITRRPCTLLERTPAVSLAVDPQRCNDCGLCLELGCPALSRSEERAVIDATICTGCGLCLQVCRRKAIAELSPKEGGTD
ncbi:MAG: indolepyruvate ferredoxin oxidoreductase subunit alpha, partial [Firmicutes bacterium]|nr:indolepyruvate ferredoxin oxidoreductase subunit alpha [Bacillota bacterium]